MPRTRIRIEWNGSEYAATPSATDGQTALLDEIDAQLDERSTNPRGAAGRITQALEDSPEWIDGWLERARLHDEMFEHAKSTADRRTAFDTAMRAIPPDCDGPLPWRRPTNRPILRAIAAWTLTKLERKEYAEAARVARRLLKLNPGDDQGMLELIGPCELRAGNAKEAAARLAAAAPEYPAMRYELALLQFEASEFVKAVTTLRRALIENPYIGEGLLNSEPQRPMPLWEESKATGREGATAYIDLWGERWRSNADALGFLRWAQTHPRLAAERGHSLEPREALLWERDEDQRIELTAIADALLNAIDEDLSTELMSCVDGSDDLTNPPWTRVPATTDCA